MTRDEDHEAMWPANRILLVGHLIIVILVHKDIIISSIGHNSRIVIILLVGRNNSHQIRIL